MKKEMIEEVLIGLDTERLNLLYEDSNNRVLADDWAFVVTIPTAIGTESVYFEERFNAEIYVKEMKE